MQKDIIMELKDITKSFSGNVVLNKINFTIRPGEIHALLGENGAGKSTLLNIMSGSLKMDSGNICMSGGLVELINPVAARKKGIIKVHQELQIIPDLTVAENIFLGDELLHPVTKAIWYKKMQMESDEILAELNADFKSTAIAKNLSAAQKQLVEIAKALRIDFSVLILDEPTSSLTTKEIGELFKIMKMLKEQGKAIIFVSHRLNEVLEISDVITVLRDGVLVNTLNIEDVSKKMLLQMMTGRDLSQSVSNSTSYDEKNIVLSVRNLTSSENIFRDISFDLHKGEILGFAGLVGSGRTEIVRAIFGADKIASGEIYVEGEKVNFNSPKDSMKKGIALIPEDRKLHGMIGILSNKRNVNLCSYNRLKKHGIISEKSEKENAEHFMKSLNVHPFDLELKTFRLSGGNQQKVIVAKWMSTNAGIIIMDEPTRGIDVGAKDEIYRLMLKLIKEGNSILMISSDLPEVISMSNRILVIYEGRITGEVMHEDATENNILHYAMGES